MVEDNRSSRMLYLVDIWWYNYFSNGQLLKPVHEVSCNLISRSYLNLEMYWSKYARICLAGVQDVRFSAACPCLMQLLVLRPPLDLILPATKKTTWLLGLMATRQKSLTNNLEIVSNMLGESVGVDYRVWKDEIKSCQGPLWSWYAVRDIDTKVSRISIIHSDPQACR